MALIQCLASRATGAGAPPGPAECSSPAGREGEEGELQQKPLPALPAADI